MNKEQIERAVNKLIELYAKENNMEIIKKDK